MEKRKKIPNANMRKGKVHPWRSSKGIEGKKQR